MIDMIFVIAKIVKYTIFLPWITWVYILRCLIGDILGGIVGHLSAFIIYFFSIIYFVASRESSSRNISRDYDDYDYDNYDIDYEPEEDDRHRCKDGSLDMRYKENRDDDR